jgi:hypothetical protein
VAAELLPRSQKSVRLPLGSSTAISPKLVERQLQARSLSQVTSPETLSSSYYEPAGREAPHVAFRGLVTNEKARPLGTSSCSKPSPKVGR